MVVYALLNAAGVGESGWAREIAAHATFDLIERNHELTALGLGQALPGSEAVQVS
jgi:hypothetical protein